MRYRLIVAVLVATFIASGVSFTSADMHPMEDDKNESSDGEPPVGANLKEEERGVFDMSWASKVKSWIPALRSVGNKDDALANTVKTSTEKVDDMLAQGAKKVDDVADDVAKAANPAFQQAEQKLKESGEVADKLKELTRLAANTYKKKDKKLDGLEKALALAKQATKDAKVAEKAAPELEKKAATATRIMAEKNEQGSAALVKAAAAEKKSASKALREVGTLWDKAKTKQIKLRGKARIIEAGGTVGPTKKMIAGALATVATIFAVLAGMSAMKAAANDKLVPLESMSGSGMSDSLMPESTMPDSTMSGSDMSGLLGL